MKICVRKRWRVCLVRDGDGDGMMESSVKLEGPYCVSFDEHCQQYPAYHRRRAQTRFSQGSLHRRCAAPRRQTVKTQFLRTFQVARKHVSSRSRKRGGRQRANKVLPGKNAPRNSAIQIPHPSPCIVFFNFSLPPPLRPPIFFSASWNYLGGFASGDAANPTFTFVGVKKQYRRTGELDSITQ